MLDQGKFEYSDCVRGSKGNSSKVMLRFYGGSVDTFIDLACDPNEDTACKFYDFMSAYVRGEKPNPDTLFMNISTTNGFTEWRFSFDINRVLLTLRYKPDNHPDIQTCKYFIANDTILRNTVDGVNYCCSCGA